MTRCYLGCLLLAALVLSSVQTPQQPATYAAPPEKPKPVVQVTPTPEPTPAPEPVSVPVEAPAPVVVPSYSRVWSSGSVIAGVNGVRAERGLAPLSENSRLDASAYAKANDMCTHDYWAHTSPSGVSPWHWFTYAGYYYAAAGENLAYDFDTIDGTIQGWTNSPTHYADMIGAYQDIGSASISCPNYQSQGAQIITVNHFGRLP